MHAIWYMSNITAASHRDTTTKINMLHCRYWLSLREHLVNFFLSWEMQTVELLFHKGIESTTLIPLKYRTLSLYSLRNSERWNPSDKIVSCLELYDHGFLQTGWTVYQVLELESSATTSPPVLLLPNLFWKPIYKLEIAQIQMIAPTLSKFKSIYTLWQIFSTLYL